MARVVKPRAGAFSLPHSLPIHKSPHQSPHVVMPSHHLLVYLLIRRKERRQRRRASSIGKKCARRTMKEKKTMATNERMSAIKQTATLKGDTQMNTNRETSATRESKMKITPSKLIRWTGLAAIVAGIIFAGYQPIQPPEVLSSVTTGTW